ncbi:(2Fe-2S) ferredoxin domain-containing protein [Tistrella bauzanensis]|uniref:(2Fe-2S) ferredoxin domain-containing protein n=1 Tax=Tistrella arctica TaxID=3133430 RepID=A0ABU9YGP8_9PROT
MSGERLDPPLYYERHIFVCTNERPAGHPRGCCEAGGATKLRNYMKARAKELGIPSARVNNAGCLDRCELGPTLVIYPEGVWYGYRTTEDIDEILTVHIAGGGRVERLMLKPGDDERAKAALAEARAAAKAAAAAG